MNKEQIMSIVEIRNLIDKEIANNYGSNKIETKYRERLSLGLKAIEQALEDLDVYKKALDISCFRLENCNWNQHNESVEQIVQEILDLVRNGLPNEK